MVEIQYYHPSDIFWNNSWPRGMTGAANIDLAKSFLHSRFQFRYDNGIIAHYKHGTQQNAGAVALYHKNGINKYIISENLRYKKYNAVSERIGCTSYGHTERKLMKEILDDLLSANFNDQFKVPKLRSIEFREGEKAALKFLTENADIYKYYLEKDKKIIIKMWSERPPCDSCEEFLRNICPEGSQVGYTIMEWGPYDNYNGAPKVRRTGEELWDAYCAYEFDL